VARVHILGGTRGEAGSGEGDAPQRATGSKRAGHRDTGPGGARERAPAPAAAGTAGLEKPKGFAFVEFRGAKARDAVRRAVAMTGHSFGDRRVRVDWAAAPRPRAGAAGAAASRAAGASPRGRRARFSSAP
jgi:hypothetical protein